MNNCRVFCVFSDYHRAQKKYWLPDTQGWIKNEDLGTAVWNNQLEIKIETYLQAKYFWGNIQIIEL